MFIERVIKNLGRKDVLAAGLFGSLVRRDFKVRGMIASFVFFMRVSTKTGFLHRLLKGNTNKENTKPNEPKIDEFAKAYLRRRI
jgi:hypothetical protein